MHGPNGLHCGGEIKVGFKRVSIELTFALHKHIVVKKIYSLATSRTPNKNTFDRLVAQKA